MIVLGNPIDIPTVMGYLGEGRTLIASVIGYRSDLRVTTVENGLVIMKAPEGHLFGTNPKNISTITVS